MKLIEVKSNHKLIKERAKLNALQIYEKHPNLRTKDGSKFNRPKSTRVNKNYKDLNIFIYIYMYIYIYIYIIIPSRTRFQLKLKKIRI